MATWKVTTKKILFPVHYLIFLISFFPHQHLTCFSSILKRKQQQKSYFKLFILYFPILIFLLPFLTRFREIVFNICCLHSPLPPPVLISLFESGIMSYRASVNSYEGCWFIYSKFSRCFLSFLHGL